MVQIINQNNNYNYNVVNDYKSDEEANKNLFDEDATKLKTTVNTKVIQVMKMLQVSYNDDVNKTNEEAAQ